MISEEDKLFIDEIIYDELNETLLYTLDEKLKDPAFKTAYLQAIDAKYSGRSGKLLGYAPMLILGVLILLGIALVFTL